MSGKLLSLESARKAAKSLRKKFRQTLPEALRRIQTHHPRFSQLSLEATARSTFSLRDAQLVVAREHGFKDWKELGEEIFSRIEQRNRELFLEASTAIREKKPEQLEQLLTAHPALATLEHGHDGSLLEQTLSYANWCGDDPEFWTCTACAKLLLEAGSEVSPYAYLRALTTGDRPSFDLFYESGKLPRCLRLDAAAGRLELVQERLKTGLLGEGTPRDTEGNWPNPDDRELLLSDALRYACRLDRQEVARYLSRELSGNEQLADSLLENRAALNLNSPLSAPQQEACLKLQRAAENEDVPTFKAILGQFPEFLEEGQLAWQVGLLEECAYMGRTKIASALLELDARVKYPPHPSSMAMRYALDYGNKPMVNLLRPMWQPTEDIPTSAALGDLVSLQRQLSTELSETLVYPEGRTLVERSRILTHALGLACMNEELEAATLLLDAGADPNSTWGLHEPATILHELAGHGKLKALNFLLERGADPNIRDQRYQATPLEWAEFMGQEAVQKVLSDLS